MLPDDVSMQQDNPETWGIRSIVGCGGPEMAVARLSSETLEIAAVSEKSIDFVGQKLP